MFLLMSRSQPQTVFVQRVLASGGVSLLVLGLFLFATRQDLANTLRTKARRPASQSQPNTPRIAQIKLLSLRSLSSVVALSTWIRANAPLNSRRSRSARFGPFFTLIHSDLLQSSRYYQLQFARQYIPKDLRLVRETANGRFSASKFGSFPQSPGSIHRCWQERKVDLDRQNW